MSEQTLDEREARVREQERKLQQQEQHDKEPEPEVVEPGTDIASARDVWPHETLDMFGETWEVRKPPMQAVTMIALSSSRYAPEKMQIDILQMFLNNYFSERSRDRVYERMMDADDTDFDQQTLGQLVRAMSNMEARRAGE